MAAANEGESVRTPRFPAQTDADWHRLMAAKQDAPEFIRTKDQWERVVGSRLTGDDPLPGCEAETIEAFSKSLVFRDGGLAGADFGRVAATLSFNDFRRLFERFGIGLGYFADHEGYECKSRGTCSARGGHICTSNC
jgi:hypothetical protein